MCNRIRKVLLCCCALLLLFCAAHAEEILEEIQMATYATGGFPNPYAVMPMADDGFEEYVAEQLMNGAAEIDIRSFNFCADSKEEAEAILVPKMESVLNNRPRLYYVGGTFKFARLPSSGLITKLIPNYLFSGEALQESLASFDSTVDEIAAHASDASTTLGKLMLVNDYFCVNYNYDYTYSIYRPDQLFTGKTGVCQAYMLAYRAVLDELGITSTYAASPKEYMNHTWNVVLVDGNWYHIDVTWNDPGATYPLMAKHDNFMLSDDGIYANKHYGWTSGAYGADTSYDDFFWRDSWTPFGVSGTEMYYLGDTNNDGMRSLLCWDSATGETTEIRCFGVHGYDGSFGMLNISRPAAIDESHIYHVARDNLIAVNLDGSDPELVYACRDGREIFSCWREGDTIRMMLGADPNNCEVVSCSADNRVPLWTTVTPAFVELDANQGVYLEAALPTGIDMNASFTWSSEDESIAEVDENGLVFANDGGMTHITASYEGAIDGETIVLTEGAVVLNLPASMETVEREALTGTAAQVIRIPEGTTSIQSRAFADSPNLLYAILPYSLESIAGDAFEGCENLQLVCIKDSAAHKFAQDSDIPYLMLYY